MTGIVFSKDRAMQLHALLDSYREMAEHGAVLRVLFACSSRRHARAYRELREMFEAEQVEFVKQPRWPRFKNWVLAALRSLDADEVFFLVDDDIFVRSVDFADLAAIRPRECVFSLRLGTCLRRSYALDREQPLPPFRSEHPFGPEKLVWRWSEGTADWGYPLSLDGHVYDRRELIGMMEAFDFRGPNSLEGGLEAHFGDSFRERLGASYRDPVIVNIPANRVQDEVRNRHGGLHHDRLLELWERGYRIDRAPIRGIRPESCHLEIDFEFQKMSR